MKEFAGSKISKVSRKYLYLGSGIFMLGVTYTNCSKIQISEITATGKAATLGAPSEVVAPQSPQSLMNTCAEAKASGRLRTKLLTASYPDTGKACDWGVNGNLSTMDVSIRARHEQRQVFQVANIADGKVAICNIKLASSAVSKFYYDDNVFITLNNYVLASTSDFTRHLESTNGFFRYDWNRLLNKPAQNSGADTVPSKQYCAGAFSGQSACEFPQTETEGVAKLHFGETVIQNILGMTNSTQFELSVITTGDNDATDCQHVPIDLNLDVEYVIE